MAVVTVNYGGESCVIIVYKSSDFHNLNGD